MEGQLIECGPPYMEILATKLRENTAKKLELEYIQSHDPDIGLNRVSKRFRASDYVKR